MTYPKELIGKDATSPAAKLNQAARRDQPQETEIPAMGPSERALAESYRNATQQSASQPPAMMRLLEAARTAPGFRAHVAVGNTDAHAVSAVVPVASEHVRLYELLPAAPVGPHDYPGEVIAKYSSGTVQMSAAIASASRVANAGAMIIPISPYTGRPDLKMQYSPDLGGHREGGDVFYNRASHVSLIGPAPFAALPNTTAPTVTESDFPALRAQIDLGAQASHAVRFEVSRRDQKMVKDEMITFEMMVALTQGIARLVDSLLLRAIAGYDPLAPTAPPVPPGAFSLGAAAAKNLTFGSLRALVGTDADGAAVGGDGMLRAAGVPGELTDTVAGTYIGDFTRAAVAIYDDIHLLVERRDASGRLTVTAFITAEAVLPDPAAFWLVD